jgi:hypothetical protein
VGDHTDVPPPVHRPCLPLILMCKKRARGVQISFIPNSGPTSSCSEKTYRAPPLHHSARASTCGRSLHEFDFPTDTFTGLSGYIEVPTAPFLPRTIPIQKDRNALRIDTNCTHGGHVRNCRTGPPTRESLLEAKNSSIRKDLGRRRWLCTSILSVTGLVSRDRFISVLACPRFRTLDSLPIDGDHRISTDVPSDSRSFEGMH